MLFKEIIAVYSENHMEHINTMCSENIELLTATECGKHSINNALKIKGLTKMVRDSEGSHGSIWCWS
jgi:hypothetical protein